MIQNTARRAPHQGQPQQYAPPAPNAALLIDFDNVTMGIRSDLGKEMKALLNSEVIRGKVAVQRAYADWRRYPQYIVPLAESSIDLIFAPAYGSSKKNATDLRMAIDAIELVFTRPEIGTYILMTGDSDFSSCVLKLKEYGKYVIGVGMRESSSDLLVQNCDEYYSYHALSGLTRSDDVVESKEDPWVLLKRAAQQMVKRGDVMRTDRLKQVMLELDPAFDEKAVGYGKFSRFVQEASTKGLLKLRKGENGQYEIVMEGESGDGAAATTAPSEPSTRRDEGDGRRRRGGRGRGRDRDREDRKPAPPEIVTSETAGDGDREEAAGSAPEASTPTVEAEAKPEPTTEAKAETAGGVGDEAAPIRSLEDAYGLLQLALRELADGGKVRDGDVKRRMLDLSPGFDEGTLGFSKFTRFLRQAHDAEAIDLERVNGGNYEVSLPSSAKRFKAPRVSTTAGAATRSAARSSAASKTEASKADTGADAAKAEEPRAKAPAAGKSAEGGRGGRARAEEKPSEPSAQPAAQGGNAPSGAGTAARRGVGSMMRRGGRAGAGADGPPPILPGQAVGGATAAKPAEEKGAAAESSGEEKKTTRGRGRKSTAGTKKSAASGKSAAKAAEEAPAKSAEKPASKRGRSKKADAETAAEPKNAAAAKKSTRGRKAAAPSGTGSAGSLSAEDLRLPRGRDAIVAYLTNSYKGVGKKTADSLLDAFGDDVFRVMRDEPNRVREAVGGRAKGLLEQWEADFARRRESDAGSSASSEPATEENPDEKPKPRTRRGSRGGRGRKKTEKSAG